VTATNNSHENFTTLPDREYYVLTVAGADNSPFTFEAKVDGKQVKLYPCVANEHGDLKEINVTFLPDDVVGTFASPIILTNDKNITGIKEMEYIENGAGAVYDLQGRRVDSSIPKKGIYIVDGYKVVVK
jgi:hypothetical protein